MEKIDITALGPMNIPESKQIMVNDATVVITPRLAYGEFVAMMQESISFILGNKNFISAVLVELISRLMKVKYYTNIDLSFLETADATLSDFYDTYDILEGNHFFTILDEQVDAVQNAKFDKMLVETLKSVLDYQNSTVGIIETLSNNAAVDTTAFQNALDVLKNGNDLEEAKKLLNIIHEQEVLES